MWQFVLLYESLKAAIKHQHQVEWNLQTAGKVTCCQRVANYFVLFINRKGGASLQQEVFCPTSFLRPNWTWLIAEPSRSARTRILSTASKEMFGQMNHGIKYVNPLSFLFLPSVGGRSSNWRFRTFMEIYGTIMSFFAPLFGEERSCDPLECVNGCLPRQPVVTNQAMSVCPEGISWKIGGVLRREKFDTFANQIKYFLK